MYDCGETRNCGKQNQKADMMISILLFHLFNTTIKIVVYTFTFEIAGLK